MKHLIVCREYPPVPGGGIGTYGLHISRLLAEKGEIVHVIAQAWREAEVLEKEFEGRLVVHRLPLVDWTARFRLQPHPSLRGSLEIALLRSGFYPQAFAWQAALLAERLVEEESIDLIEAQEYEAPLYYFLLRRALGLGPGRRPACLIHLHSPTEFLARYNEWSGSSDWVQTAKRLEDYCIASADALLCPSRSFAQAAEQHYGLTAGRIEVIPLPIGSGKHLERTRQVWEQGSIAYVGRLERRKGVLEWLRAAVEAARRFPQARFEFAGANILGSNRISSQVMIDEIIPAQMKNRFIFLGEQNRVSVQSLLRRSRLAVVPSRWENFPYVCIEAMSSGLPVLAAPQGGLLEMVENDRTGWLAMGVGTDGLADTLQRALATPPDVLAEMGSCAARAIRELCDNQKILASHLDYRERVASRAAGRSFQLPANLPQANWPFDKPATRRVAAHTNRRGLAVVVLEAENAHRLQATLHSLVSLPEEPAKVALLRSGQHLPEALHEIQEGGSYPLGVVFLEAGQVLSPMAIGAALEVLHRQDLVGLVSFWTRLRGGGYNVRIHPCPSLPYQRKANHVSPASVYRLEALEEICGRIAGLQPGEETCGEMANAVLEGGWVAVTLPGVLVVQPRLRDAGFFNPFFAMPQDAWGRRPEIGLLLRHPFSSVRAVISTYHAAIRTRRRAV